MPGAIGRRLRQYRQCAILLERELGVQPLPETVSLYEVVLMGAPRQAVGAPQDDARCRSAGGRAEALRSCVAPARGRRRSGRHGADHGQAGIGNKPVYFAAQLRRAIVLVAAGQPGAQSLPYGLITQAMRSRLRIDAQSGCSPPASYRLSPVWVAEVARLLPELETGGFAPARNAQLPGDEARLRLFEGLIRFIQAMTLGAEPAVLCLDNLHWADSATLDWLAYLGTQLLPAAHHRRLPAMNAPAAPLRQG